MILLGGHLLYNTCIITLNNDITGAHMLSGVAQRQSNQVIR